MTNTSLSSEASLSYSLNNASSGLLLEFRIMKILFVMSVTFSEVDIGPSFGMNLQDIVLPYAPPREGLFCALPGVTADAFMVLAVFFCVHNILSEIFLDFNISYW